MDTFHFHKTDTNEQRNRVLDNLHTKLHEKLGRQDIELTIKRLKKEPSNKARGYVFGYLIPTMRKGFYFFGNEFSKQEVYLLLKKEGKFYYTEEVKLNGKIIKQTRFETFSNKGDSKRIAEFIDFCLRYASENLQQNLETPDEYKERRGIKELNLI